MARCKGRLVVFHYRRRSAAGPHLKSNMHNVFDLSQPAAS